MFGDFCGNRAAVATLGEMIRLGRIQQTILLEGPEGAGKATLARRFAAELLGGAGKIEQDDLSLPHNTAIVAEREKWPADKRVEDPLFFATHPDFVTFAPDGPLRQISIQQMRLLKDRARYKPLKGDRRVFLIDHIDRANDQAANSLLKILEEPPDHLVLFLTAKNSYDLLPTIRSRAVPLRLSPLSRSEMEEFVRARGLADAGRRIALAAGSPGLAVSLDLATYDRRRAAMMVLLEAASGRAPFASWVKQAEAAGSRAEKLETCVNVLYTLLGDILVSSHGGGVKNPDLAEEIGLIAASVSFAWLRAAVRKVDEMAAMLRRNIQKNIALDAFVVEMRAIAARQQPA